MIKDIKQFFGSQKLYWWMNPFVITEIIMESKKEKVKNPTTKLDTYKQFYKK